MLKTLALAATAVVLAAGAVSLAPRPAVAPQPAGGTPPGVLDLSKVKLTIVGTAFVTELAGTNDKTFKETEPEKFRGLVVMVRVQKPAGEPVTLCAQDLTLHYRHGDGDDAIRCTGLSAFSTQEGVDRPMSLYSGGYGRTTTGPATMTSEAVYVDLFFQFMEASTSDIHLLVAQPVGAAYKTDGWK